MTTKKLNEIVKGLPSTDNPSGKTLLVHKNGELENISATFFARCVTVNMAAGAVYRIRNIRSALIACRGHLGQQSALVWVSSYGAGTKDRTQSREIYRNSVYQFYYNGSSDSSACVYVTITKQNTDTMTVTSLSGEMPVIERVDALPSDATVMNFT